MPDSQSTVTLELNGEFLATVRSILTKYAAYESWGELQRLLVLLNDLSEAYETEVGAWWDGEAFEELAGEMINDKDASFGGTG